MGGGIPTRDDLVHYTSNKQLAFLQLIPGGRAAGVKTNVLFFSKPKDVKQDKAQIVFYLLAATDGHAKNFSITHLPNNKYKLTPLYDALFIHQ